MTRNDTNSRPILKRKIAKKSWCKYRVSHQQLIQSKDLTWPDVLTIYQKLVLSGFLSCGILCLIHYLKLFWHHMASTASERKDAKIQHESSWFFQRFIFSKHREKVILVLELLNSRTSVVILQALEISPASLTSAASATSLASTASKSPIMWPSQIIWSLAIHTSPIHLVFLLTKVFCLYRNKREKNRNFFLDVPIKKWFYINPY